MTQEALAARLGISREAVTMWETGKTSPQVKYLTAIAEILGCTVDELLQPMDDEA